MAFKTAYNLAKLLMYEIQLHIFRWCWQFRKIEMRISSNQHIMVKKTAAEQDWPTPVIVNRTRLPQSLPRLYICKSRVIG